MATAKEYGRALYRYLNQSVSGEAPVGGSPVYERIAEMQRIERHHPDGTVEVFEQIVSDERSYQNKEK